MINTILQSWRTTPWHCRVVPTVVNRFIAHSIIQSNKSAGRPHASSSTAYHRKKLASDSLYREQCRDSQRKWREKNPEYARAYSQRRRSVIVDSVKQSAQLEALGRLAKNSVAYDLRACTASIWLVGPDPATAKNIAATAQLIVVQVKRESGKAVKNISLSR